MDSLKYYVGIQYEGPSRQVIVCVKTCEAQTSGLDRVKPIDAPNPDEAARKYIELITGGKAAVRRPN